LNLPIFSTHEAKHQPQKTNLDHQQEVNETPYAQKKISTDSLIERLGVLGANSFGTPRIALKD
jgi:hypothetical protein